MWLVGDSVTLSERTQFKLPNDPVPFDQDVWWSIDFNIDGQTPEPGIWNTWYAFHQSPDDGDLDSSGPVICALGPDGTTLDFSTRYTDEAIATHYPIQTTHYSVPMQWGHTYRMVGRVKFGRTAGGSVDLWVDGSKVVSYTGRIGFNDAIGPYFTAGLYRKTGSAKTLKGVFENVKVSLTPLPTP